MPWAAHQDKDQLQTEEGRLAFAAAAVGTCTAPVLFVLFRHFQMRRCELHLRQEMSVVGKRIPAEFVLDIAAAAGVEVVAGNCPFR